MWLLGNNGHDTEDLLVLESHPEDGNDLDETPERLHGRCLVFDHDVCDELAGVEDAQQEMKEEQWNDEYEWLQYHLGGTSQAPRGAGIIVAHYSDRTI